MQALTDNTGKSSNAEMPSGSCAMSTKEWIPVNRNESAPGQ